MPLLSRTPLRSLRPPSWPKRHLRAYSHYEGTGLTAEQYAEGNAKAVAWMREDGWDMGSLIEQNIVWGHQDSFQHVNNVHYIRFAETGRMQFVKSLVPELDDPEKAELGLVRGKKEGGVGVILGSISAVYKRPVTYPDVLLVGHRPKEILQDRFLLESCCFSYMQQKVVTLGKADMVMYDYGALRKAKMPDDLRKVLEKRLK